MIKKFILLINIIIFNFSFCNEMNIKINRLKKENILKIEDGTAYIKKSKWITMSKNEKINFLEILNKYNKLYKEKYITTVKEMETGEELVIIGIFGVELIDEEKQSPD